MLTLEVIAYILSLAFQVAGAVLLIIKYWGKTWERITDEYFPGSNIIERDDNNDVRLDKKKVQLCAQRVYDNRMAFVFIAVGYILTVFGEIGGICRCCILLYVIMVTLIIILLEKGISVVVSKIFYGEDIVIPYEEIKSKADTVVTSSEIDKMFEDIKDEQKK